MKLIGRLNQKGDTLVEVTIALAILSMVLVSSFSLAGSAYRLGSSAKERSQAANGIQRQAEGLRNYRDSHNWTDFRNAITGAPVFGFNQEFHMAIVSNRWNLSTSPARKLTDGIFTYFIMARDINPDKIQFDIRAEWEEAGRNGVVINSTTITTYLVNLDGMGPGGPPAPLVPVVILAGTPASVAIGQPIQLDWSVVNGATSCVASSPDTSWSGAKNPLSGTENRPGDAGSAGSRTYTLTCTNAGGTGSATTTVTIGAPPPPPPSPLPIWRLYAGDPTYDHFYTIDVGERDAVNDCITYCLEGAAFMAFANLADRAGLVRVFRLYSPSQIDHFYTSDAGQRDFAIANGYSWESGGDFYAWPKFACPVPVYRLWHSGIGDHFYTADASERDSAVVGGYVEETYDFCGD